MSAEKLLFNFSRKLPEPFNKLPSTKVKVASKYTTGSTDATLTATVMKALLAYCRCMDASGLGAVGQCEEKIIAEYKSSTDADDTYHIVVYDPIKGNVMVSIFQKSTENVELYKLQAGKKDGAAIMMAMIPALMADSEFEDNFKLFNDEYKLGFTDMAKSTDLAGILCDNVYRRVNDSKCSAYIKVNVDNNPARVSRTHLDNNTFKPDMVHAGEFSIFSQTFAPVVYTSATATDHSDFIGKYKLNPSRTLTIFEQQLVPVLDSSYILPAEIVSVCKHAQRSTGKQTQMRSYMFRGAAGSGKTKGAKAMAAGLGLPYMKYTCSANSEIFDFVGQLFPDTDSGSTGDAVLDEERKKLKEMGGMTYENVANLMGLPGFDDMDYDPAGVYQSLTGTEKTDASSQDCIGLILNMVADKIQKLSAVKPETLKTGQTFTYIETDFIKALKNGYLVEIQEPSTIMQPGVLVGLNSLLEQEGSITLPTGEIIERHPDAVVVITTNIDYEGCRAMNQSILDRMNMIIDINLPSPEIMAQRAISITGADDELLVSQMVRVVNDMSDYCRKNGIMDGSVGMRSLIDWINSTEITEDPYESALITVVSKATSNETDRSSIISAILEPIFAPKTAKKAV